MTVNTYTPKAIQLTEAAAQHFEQYLAKHADAIGLRLAVKEAGCSNKKYVTEPVITPNTDDQMFTSHGISIYVQTGDLRYVAGTEIDYVQDGINRVLKYNNPLAVNACGCGESFDVDMD